MYDFFYIPETAGLHIPFYGEINLVFWLFVVAAFLTVYAFLPEITKWLFTSAVSGLKSGVLFLIAKIRELYSGVKAAKKAKSKKSATVETDESFDPLSSLQDLTAWAVHSGDPKTLAQVTPLFTEVQKKIAVAMLIFATFGVSGCTSTAEPVDVKQKCGWIGPAPDSSIQQTNQSFRTQAPQYFK